ncbi:MAG: hypothetical protein HKO95_16865 [Rhodobacteraceae bacterium]|jgi:hypothetical protein|nr:hypothetical protein [Alphaproteobacteria bacterium]MBT8476966.1 hypothetical protein [Alphaproteobacteria bacterium]NNF71617.1 hypothetical protein [Paracoccaceae bacterium]NNK68398.1 hypothetical protein [Paracoccaceae bacterium]
MTVTAFSSSNVTFKPAGAFLVLALAFTFGSLSQSPKGYTLEELPSVYVRAISDLFGG